jgi:hypothetical protein
MEKSKGKRKYNIRVCLIERFTQKYELKVLTLIGAVVYYNNIVIYSANKTIYICNQCQSYN